MIDISDHYDGAKLRTVVDGKKIWTPMIIVFAAIGVTDLLFAIDSIPAIFGITQSPFIVFTANIFALMGLRQLYFLLGDLLDRLRYLHYGIAFILAFIGVKLVFHAMHVNELPFINDGEPIEWAPEISTWMSLGGHRPVDGRRDDREPGRVGAREEGEDRGCRGRRRRGGEGHSADGRPAREPRRSLSASVGAGADRFAPERGLRRKL